MVPLSVLLGLSEGTVDGCEDGTLETEGTTDGYFDLDGICEIDGADDGLRDGTTNGTVEIDGRKDGTVEIDGTTVGFEDGAEVG